MAIWIFYSCTNLTDYSKDMAIYKNVIDGSNDPNQTSTVIHYIYFNALALDQMFAVLSYKEIIKLKTQKHLTHNKSNFSCGSDVIVRF